MGRKRNQRRQQHGSAWHWKHTDCAYYTMPGTKKRVPLSATMRSRMSDRTTDVFLMCTCNDISKLPPEFSRSKRFDGIGFLDVPGVQQRRAIWRICLDLIHTTVSQDRRRASSAGGEEPVIGVLEDFRVFVLVSDAFAALPARGYFPRTIEDEPPTFGAARVPLLRLPFLRPADRRRLPIVDPCVIYETMMVSDKSTPSSIG